MPPIESTTQILILWGVIGYVFGSIPTGIILAKVMNLGDLRAIGSGNIGATNVLRTGNKKAAVLTLLIDAGKGAVAVLLALRFGAMDAAQLAGLMALFGHCFPAWLKFKGGKGVATYLGVIGALAWPMGLAACGIWLIVALISRYSSLAALVAAGWLPVVMLFTGFGVFAFLAMAMAMLIYARHWANIQRLRQGTETKIGGKVSGAQGPSGLDRQ
ncbi:glycerol-3-phosphate 1-O-acyltransferase PlsY [Yoonia sp. 2307UL14-13]|uniref:glycerol-3-phosphate 1-O-acyltransferase PlsY n=1 Tax=Yoonia sp. 2307UL14-13 TaxID=3126506 RepID=UPI0030AE688E